MADNAPTQTDIAAFLSRSGDGPAVRRIDTHAAMVFIAGDRVLKVKRAVKFPFLDYTTLDRRKAACEAEIAVNRPFAPHIYRGVVAITRSRDGHLALGGAGEPVEWAVEMARFDDSRTLDHLADRNAIDRTLADALGRTVAEAHARADAVTDARFASALREITMQNEAELFGSPTIFPQALVGALADATRARLTAATGLLVTRESKGYVRRCHGDLHLGNIVLIDDKPVLFDAIEFDARISTIDVVYDLAFLLMDLIARDRNDLACVVLNRYLAASRSDDQLDALALLPLLMSVRAAIRAKVAAARAPHSGDRTATERSARDYFDLARRLLLTEPPSLVAVGGLSGTGKSVLAGALLAHIAPLPGAVWLRSDVERKALFGIAETDKAPAQAYTPEVTARVYAALAAKARRVLDAGHSAVVDAVFARPDERAAIAAAAGGHAFTGLYLTADMATRVARVGGRTGDASDADATVAAAQERYDIGALDWMRIDAGGTPDDTFAHAIKALHP